MSNQQEHLLEMAQTLGRIEGKLDGYAERTTKLEHAAERQWWVSYVVTPVVIGLGHIARIMGVKGV